MNREENNTNDNDNNDSNNSNIERPKSANEIADDKKHAFRFNFKILNFY